jgi:ketosteroid isomerase-like protein
MDMSELEARLKTLEEDVRATRDLEAIKQLQYRYINGLAFADWDAMLDCFADDAVFDVGLPDHPPYRGLDEIKRRFVDVISKGHHGTDGVFLVHPIITVCGDTAKGTWLLYWMVSYQATGQALFWMQSTYDMEYVRTDQGWRFSVLRFDNRLRPPMGPGWVPIEGESPFPGT